MFTIDDIHGALDNEEFFLEYIPTMSLPDQRCVGAEALIRWQKDDKVIYPADFITVIENTPLSGLVTYWVIKTVSNELRSWLIDRKDVHISINIPPEIIGRGGIHFATKISRLTDVSDKMMFEITERGVVDALGIAAINMATGYNMKVALDDITVNDANLLVLSRLAATIVKLDKAFADEMLQPEWTDQKMAGISALIDTGDLRVIAEGIETSKQVEIIVSAGIQMAQGWYFSRSLRAADFIDYYQQHH